MWFSFYVETTTLDRHSGDWIRNHLLFHVPVCQPRRHGSHVGMGSRRKRYRKTRWKKRRRRSRRERRRRLIRHTRAKETKVERRSGCVLSLGYTVNWVNCCILVSILFFKNRYWSTAWWSEICNYYYVAHRLFHSIYDLFSEQNCDKVYLVEICISS